MRDAVMVELVRTPVGRRNGSLAECHPVDLAAHAIRALVERTSIDPHLIDDVILGCVTQLGDQSSNIARFAALAAGLPEQVPGVTVNRACGSSQQAIDYATASVVAGHHDIVIAGGIETMSRVPLGAARESGMPYGPTVLRKYDNFSFNQGLSAEMVAEHWSLSRSDLDTFAVRSHSLAAATDDEDLFVDEIAPVTSATGRVERDEGIRRGTTTERLSTLKPVFTDDGVIHAGNSSQISDGAAAVLIMTSDRARDLGLTPVVRYHAGAVIGADPVMMLTGPIDATAKALSRARLSLDDIGVYEVNEAFASVPLAWLAETKADPARLNPRGGAIALGHPLGASGAILMTRMVNHMRDNGIEFGLQTMCEGGGTANATIVQLIN